MVYIPVPCLTGPLLNLRGGGLMHIYRTLYTFIILNPIGGVIISVLASSVVDRELKPSTL